jgi:hypothetical protein
MIDDPTKTNPLALLTTAKIAAISDAVTPQREYLYASGDNTLAIAENCVFSVGEASPTSIFRTQYAAIGAANLDTGSFQAGKDYYVYVCDDGIANEVFKISLNSTFPTGYNAVNSRKIGGFHYGKCRRVDAQLRPVSSTGVAYGSGWEGNVYDGIVPRSVWTLRHRPKCPPEGMAYLGDGVWVDIYLSSDDGMGGLKSTYGGIPLTGTEGLDWYSFNDRALVMGKRLLSYGEFCRMAYGSPQGNDGNNTNAWSATTNTGRNSAGGVVNAVSSMGARDAAGNVWEWLGEFVTRYDASGVGAIGGFAWRDVLGAGNGKAHMNAEYQLVALLGGGYWGHGVYAGCRAVGCSNVPWDVNAGFGVRLACGSL